ncbi:MAG: hypothetical protein OEX97_11115 [Acidimicrobiia bacterium]|nr:hypothetical protein [Acidimicrobiia bacterium]
MKLEKHPDEEPSPRLAKGDRGRGEAGRRKEPMDAHPSPMYYGELEPVPELKPWVAAYWQFQVERDVGEIEHWIPLTGGVMLAWNPGAPVIATGPRIEPFATRVRGGDLYWGVHLWPGAAPSLLGSRILGLRVLCTSSSAKRGPRSP